ncbi:TPR domain protein [Candidatus Burkholderia brachyanthoides]|nr:TPR domain protein [Candidatus Burkholderia brachyanthoides]
MLEKYLAHHHDVDVAPDTYLYAGGVTTFQSLWMGVPTLTLPGDLIANRGAPLVLSHAGLNGFIAADQDDFVAKGTAWAGKIDELAQIRSGMRERCMQSPSFDPYRVPAALSSGIRKMWRRWCAGQVSETFDA